MITQSKRQDTIVEGEKRCTHQDASQPIRKDQGDKHRASYSSEEETKWNTGPKLQQSDEPIPPWASTQKADKVQRP